MIKSKIKLVKKLSDRFIFGTKNLLFLSMGKTLKPKWIWFGVTDNCNSHCTHCTIWKQKSTLNQLTLGELKKIFSDPLLSDVEAITNSGGEALLRDDIVEIIKLENEMFPNAVLDLSTNGILPDRALKVVQAVLDENIRINVGVSLDGYKEKHDEIRGVPGNFEKVNYLLNELIKLRKKYSDKLSIILGYTLSSLTVDEYEKVNDYAKKLNIELSVQWYNESSFYENENKHQVDETTKKKMFDIVKKQPNTMIREKWLRLLNNKSIKFKCFAAQTFFVLRCDGNMVPCLSYWDSIIGNTREQSPSKIWQSEKAKEVRKKVSECKGCVNSWGVEWNATSSFYPRLFFYIRNPKALSNRFKRKD